MRVWENRMVIELRSPLCAGSGFSFSGTIDTDLCFDTLGIPYIPGRRLKGCLREAAELIRCPENLIYRIFGERGRNGSVGLSLGNAEETHAKEIRSAVLQWNRNFPDQKVTQEEVLKQYTDVRAQTKINSETGTAEENTLRFTRILNQYDPAADNKPYRFEADIRYYAAQDEAECDTDEAIVWLNKIIKALRNIGQNRTRGLGSVRCTVKGDWALSKTAEPQRTAGENDDKPIMIVYCMTNDQAIVLGDYTGEATESYVSGTVMSGMLAEKYLQQKNHTPEDVMFRELFLDGKTKFANAYRAENGTRGIPASGWIRELKKTGKLVNMLSSEEERTASDSNDELDPYNMTNGNRPKQLRGKYLLIQNEKVVGKLETEEEIVYHHSRSGINSKKKEGLLYSLEAISAGQSFMGYIIAPHKYADWIRERLAEGFSIGKSRRTQYGRCSCDAAILPVKGAKVLKLEEEKSIVVTFISDGAFMTENGFTTEAAEIRKAIATELFGREDLEATADLSLGQQTGYSAVWNMRKISVPLVKAGSSFVFRVPAGTQMTEKRFIGTKTKEGFGEIMISDGDNRVFKLEAQPLGILSGAPVMLDGKVKSNQNTVAVEPMQKHTKRVLADVFCERILDEMTVENGIRAGKSLNPTQIGRLTLMVKESFETNKGNPTAEYNNLLKRIRSIKTESTREAGMSFVNSVFAQMPGIVQQTLDKEAQSKEQNRAGMGEKALLELIQTETVQDGNIREYCAEKLWSPFCLRVLTLLKYNKAEIR